MKFSKWNISQQNSLLTKLGIHNHNKEMENKYTWPENLHKSYIHFEKINTLFPKLTDDIEYRIFIETVLSAIVGEFQLNKKTKLSCGFTTDIHEPFFLFDPADSKTDQIDKLYSFLSNKKVFEWFKLSKSWHICDPPLPTDEEVYIGYDTRGTLKWIYAKYFIKDLDVKKIKADKEEYAGKIVKFYSSDMTKEIKRYFISEAICFSIAKSTKSTMMFDMLVDKFSATPMVFWDTPPTKHKYD